MKAINRSLLLSACLGMLLSASQSARAQGHEALAEALFEQARKEMTDGNYESACRKFRESDRLDPAIGTKFNLADCEEKQGRVATAWELFKAVESQLAASDDRRPIAKQRRLALEPVVPRLKIILAQGAPEGTTVRAGKAELGGASLGIPLPLDPGKHELVASAPGFTPRIFNVVLEQGKTSEVEVAPGSPEAAPPEPSPGQPPGQQPAAQPPAQDVGAEPAADNTTLGFVIAGVGAVGLGVGTVTGLMAMGKKNTVDDHCSEELQVCDQTGKDANDAGRTLSTVSTIGFAVGLIGLGVGTYFILTSGDGGTTETALMTRVGPAGGRLSLVQRW